MIRGRKSSLVVLLTATKRSELETIQRRTIVSAGLARRAAGSSLADVACQVGVAPRGREVAQTLPPTGPPRTRR
jgi:hypothetical protein